MRLCIVLIQYFLLNYFCYCHDLSHAEQVIANQPESPVINDSHSQVDETKNIERNDNENLNDAVDTRYDSRKPELETVESTTPSVDISMENRVPLPLDNDSISLPKSIVTQNEEQLKAPIDNDTVKNIPIPSNDKYNPKVIHQDELSQRENQISSQIIDTIKQDDVDDDNLSIGPEEQIQLAPNHIPPSSTIQPSLENSNSNDIKLDQNSQIPLQPIINDNSTVQNESHGPVSTTSQILLSASSKLHQRVHRNSSQAQISQQQIENSSKTDNNHSDNATVQQSTDEHKHSTTFLSKLEESESKLHLQSTPTDSTIDNETQTNNFTNRHLSQTEQIQNSTSISNSTTKILTQKATQVCWHLPKPFETSVELLENQIFRFTNILPKFLQTILFGHSDDREILINTLWFTSICAMCFLFSIVFLAMGTNRLKQTKHEKQIRASCQQLQHYNNRVLLESEAFERQNQKLSDEIDELKKKLQEHNSDEDIFALREECIRFQEDVKMAHAKQLVSQQDIDYKQNLIHKYEFDAQQQAKTITHLNHEIAQLKRDLEREQETVVHLQCKDLSIERFGKLQETIQQLKSEIVQLKKDKLNQNDQSQEMKEHANQRDVETSELILRMKQMKDLFERHDQTIKYIQDKLSKDKKIELEDLRAIVKDNSLTNNQNLLSTIDSDAKKSNQRIHDLHNDINMKTHRLKELELLLNQEKERCKEVETKLKIVLELRERDTHLHVRQFGQIDGQLRKARTDTERVHILQQQLELRQQQLDDVQKTLSTEQMKFNEESSKLQHETHEKWMEIKRLTRELEASKKECENLRRQITKYSKDARSSKEKSTLKPPLKHIGNNYAIESQNISPISDQQEENFRPIDHQRSDSGGTSPTEMFMPRPPIFNLSGPPFYPPPFMPHPPPNLFMMHPRFSMSPIGPHEMASPISNLVTNANEPNDSEAIDSLNITSNATNYNGQSNGVARSPLLDDEQQTKIKKTKKSLKKKTRTSATTTLVVNQGTLLLLHVKQHQILTLGPALSSQTPFIAGFGEKLGIPVVSYAATDPSLSNRNAYPAFYRTVPSDSASELAVNDAYGSGGAKVITDALIHNDLTVANMLVFDIATLRMRDILKHDLTTSSTRIIVLWAVSTNASFCFDRYFLKSKKLFDKINNITFLDVSGRIQFDTNVTDRIDGSYYFAQNSQLLLDTTIFVSALNYSDNYGWQEYSGSNVIVWPGNLLVPSTGGAKT
ncbi:unnamed protein product [Rotaria socialis]